MTIDVSLGAAVGAAPALPDASCASAATPDAASGFAALLDEVTGTDGESIDSWSAPNGKDAGDEDGFDEIAALAMTSLLSLDTPVLPARVEAVDGESAGSETGDAVAIGKVTATEPLIDLTTPAERSKAASTREYDDAAQPVASVRTAAAKDAPEVTDTAGSDAETVASVVPETPAPTTSADDAPVSDTRGEAVTPARHGHHTAPVTKTHGSKPSRPETSKAAAHHDTIAQALAATAAKASVFETPQVGGRGTTADAQAPTATATRLVRALERAAAPTGTESAAGVAPTPASDDTAGGQSSFFGGDRSAERETPSLSAIRHATGAVSVTVAAPATFDVRALARAVDAASHVADAPAVTIPERDVVAQLVQSMRVQFRNGIGEAVVKLKPEHLGSVQISLKIEHDAIKATVQAEVASVRQWLESQQDTLRTSLAEQGLRLERFVVEPDAERHAGRDDAQPREQRRQQPRSRAGAAMSAKDQPVFEVTV